MDRSSKGMQQLVYMIGVKLRSVPVRYMKLCNERLPQAAAAKQWTETFLEVHSRFMRGDFRHDSRELRDIAELAQWLANLHSACENTPPKVITVPESEMVERERVFG
jgi:hypothetical protein